MKMRSALDDLFQKSADGICYVAKAENEEIEHKKSFSFNPDVAKTCAAFANNQGGYIIFGVENQNSTLVGLSRSNARKFREYDLRKATQQLHKYFEPNIKIEKIRGEIAGKEYGIIVVYESDFKPIMSVNKDDASDLEDGVIYYSYGAVRKRIRSSELQKIIGDRIQKSMERLASLTQLAISRGPENIAIVDTVSGEGIGPNVRPFVIEKSALDSLDVVMEGRLAEAEGAPALRLVADVTTIIDERIVEQDYDIDKDRVVDTFLNQRVVDNPKLFLSAICKHEVTYAPMYFFACLADLDITALQDYLRQVPNRRQHTVDNLLNRLQRERDTADSIVPSVYKKDRSTANFAQLHRKEEFSINEKSFNSALTAVWSLETGEIDQEYILGVAKRLYSIGSSMESPYRTEVRKLICYLDRTLYPLRK